MTTKGYDFGFPQAPEAVRAAEAGPRCCDWLGCGGEGLHRAPRSRDELYRYHYFCLDHVRQYNAGWNYYAGMNDVEVEADVRRDTVWHRPSWPLGVLGGRFSASITDDFGVFGWPGRGKPDRQKTPPGGGSPEARAMAVLDLKPPLSVAALKARYKMLVKRHHPDVTGGDKASEEKFKQISLAYATILAGLTP